MGEARRRKDVFSSPPPPIDLKMRGRGEGGGRLSYLDPSEEFTVSNYISASTEPSRQHVSRHSHTPFGEEGPGPRRCLLEANYGEPPCITRHLLPKIPFSTPPHMQLQRVGGGRRALPLGLNSALKPVRTRNNGDVDNAWRQEVLCRCARRVRL